MFVIEKQNIYIINVKKNVSYCFGLTVLIFFYIIRNNFGFEIQLGDKRKRYENAFRLWKLMVLIILEGKSKIGAHVRSDIYYLICLRVQQKNGFFSEKTYFPSCMGNIFLVTI